MTTTNKEIQARPESAAKVEWTVDRPVFTPATDICEKKDALVVWCDMPGVDEKDVDITLEDNVLTLTGSQPAEEWPAHRLVYRGYETGVFRRSFQLSAEIDQARIRATMKNGVLQVWLPKLEKVLPKKIKVNADN